MRETQPVAVDSDDALGFDILQLRDDVRRVDLDGAGHHLDGRCGVAGHREQHVARRLVEAADPGPNQFGQCHRQRQFGASEVTVHCTGEFERIKRVAARNLLYPNDCRPRQ